MSDDLGDISLLQMFQMEVENRTAAMTAGLLGLEQQAPAAPVLEELMRHAHSIKGAASIVDRAVAVQVAHALEDYFVKAQKAHFAWPQERVDLLLRGVDLLSRMAAEPDERMAEWTMAHQPRLDEFLHALTRPSESAVSPAPVEVTSVSSAPKVSESAAVRPAEEPPVPTAGHALRVTAENLSRLLGLAGETLVASRWVETFAGEMLRLKKLQKAMLHSMSQLQISLAGMALDERVEGQVTEMQSRAREWDGALAHRLEEFESFEHRFFNLSSRLYREVLDCRMRPFAEGTRSFSRLVRDVGRTLEKKVRLRIVGEVTKVDREILERIEAPLGHLLRNAVDHGVEGPAVRLRAGKPAEGVVRLEARHSAGMLIIEVADDGAGIDPDALREAIVGKGLTTTELVQAFSETELFEFLFLPGFSTKGSVTQISGRGVGLDAVQSMVKEVGGTVRVSSRLGEGTKFQMQLPLTLSVLRTLVVEVGGEPYAFPLARIESTVKISNAEIESIEGREHFRLGEQHVGLVSVHQVLGFAEAGPSEAELSVIVLGEQGRRFGLVVDRLIGERELVVRPLDPRLGKIQDINAAALLPDQSPVLIFDVDDVWRSIEKLISGDQLAQVRPEEVVARGQARKRVLVVDDSLTVRELERKLIGNRGYEVDVAVDGMDGWNAVRTGHYDLIVTDIDMPRLDGIELVAQIKKDPRLHNLPVMIVSYKDRPEDRQRGLEAGADYYLTKGSFHDETLLRAVADLIGEANE